MKTIKNLELKNLELKKIDRYLLKKIQGRAGSSPSKITIEGFG